MRVVSTVDLDASVPDVSQYVEDLGRYVEWMPIVHRASNRPGEQLTWDVELRAKVGPLARSKRLTMRRTSCDTSPDAKTLHAVFERDEPDGRRHAQWVMTVALTAVGIDRPVTRLDIDLFYGGSLWTGGILEKVLSDSIDSGKKKLAELVRAN